MSKCWRYWLLYVQIWAREECFITIVLYLGKLNVSAELVDYSESFGANYSNLVFHVFKISLILTSESRYLAQAGNIRFLEFDLGIRFFKWFSLAAGKNNKKNRI